MALVKAGKVAPGQYTGLLVDFGGVLTTNVFASFQAFCQAERLAPETVREKFLSDPAGQKLLFDLETGALGEEQFEPRFGALLGVADHNGLIDRMFAGMSPDTAMLDAVRAAKRAGARTGMVSNSWGRGRYDRRLFPELFDGVVVSAEEGIRKPAPEIYALGAQRIGVDAARCVFVDDLPGNLKPARALGMATVHHRSAQDTIPELERLLGLTLA